MSEGLDCRSFLERQFRLSRAELRFVEAFLDAASMQRAAERLGITYGTARHHMRTVCAKTEASGQVELMKRLMHLALTDRWQ